MVAFAANSVLCRACAERTNIDPAVFTLVRIRRGAILALIAAVPRPDAGSPARGSGPRALRLCGGVLVRLSVAAAGAGALILFGAVQATMMVDRLVRGEHLAFGQWVASPRRSRALSLGRARRIGPARWGPG